MSMHFYNEKDENVDFIMSLRGWRRIFRLATMYGWNPEGTIEPKTWKEEMAWDSMNYFTNDGQLVTDTDAYELAVAIELAISDLKPEDPENDPLEKFGGEWEREMVRRWHYSLDSDLRDPAYIFFDEKYKNILNEFVTFCRQGAFEIY